MAAVCCAIPPSNSRPNAASAAATSAGMPARTLSALLDTSSSSGNQRNALQLGRGLIARDERQRLSTVDGGDQRRGAPALAAFGAERDAELRPRSRAQAAVRELPALEPRVVAASQQQRLLGLECLYREAAFVLARADVLPCRCVEELVCDRVAKLAGVGLAAARRGSSSGPSPGCRCNSRAARRARRRLAVARALRTRAARARSKRREPSRTTQRWPCIRFSPAVGHGSMR